MFIRLLCKSVEIPLLALSIYPDWIMYGCLCLWIHWKIIPGSKEVYYWIFTTIAVLHMLLDVGLQHLRVHQQDLQIMLPVLVLILSHHMLDRLDKVGNRLLVVINLVVVALGFGQNHPAHLLKHALIPMMETLRCRRIAGQLTSLIGLCHSTLTCEI